MAEKTKNLGLTKPAGKEKISVAILNGNFDLLDAAVGDKAASTHTHVSGDITDADTEPVDGSTKLITSGAVKKALEEKLDSLSFDDVPTKDSGNLVKSGGIFTALSNLVIKTDDELSESSDNPVKNKVIEAAVYKIWEKMTEMSNRIDELAALSPSGTGTGESVMFSKMTDAGSGALVNVTTGGLSETPAIDLSNVFGKLTDNVSVEVK
jgi:hypothetical protein